ncbi:unnamed protein product [Symbiodinium sp. CCMP2592]|nr:unnamed protein product [Symbiodinium sp. CCMP2592]
MLRKRHCWKCGRGFLRAGQKLRCGRCSVKYDNGLLPYSPLYTGPRHKPRDARMVLDAAYCFSLGVPCDAAQHLAGMNHKVAETLYENFKTVTALAEYVFAKQSFFEDEDVESDLFSTRKRKRDDQVVHEGRFLVMASRDTKAGRKRPILVPLRDRAVKAGGRPPPDSMKDIGQPLKEKLRGGCMHFTDGARANESAHRLPCLEQPLLSCNHSAKQYSRFAKLPLATLTERLRRRLEARSSSSQNSARFRVSTNMIEGYIGSLKVALRRMNSGRLPSTQQQCRSVLSAAYFRRAPGLENLGKAFQIFYEFFVDKDDPRLVWKQADEWLQQCTQLENAYPAQRACLMPSEVRQQLDEEMSYLQDLDVLETVTDITTSILERRWWWAEHVRAGVPSPLQQTGAMSFRLQVALEFDAATWRQSAEAMLSEMKIVLAHMEQNKIVYSAGARNAEAFQAFAVLVDLILAGLLQEPAGSHV